MNEDRGKKILEINVAGREIRNILLKKRYIFIVLFIYAAGGLLAAFVLYSLGFSFSDIIFPILVAFVMGICLLIVIVFPGQKLEITTNGIAIKWNFIRSFRKWSEFNSYSVDRASKIIYLHREKTLDRPLAIVAEENLDEVEKIISKYLEMRK